MNFDYNNVIVLLALSFIYVRSSIAEVGEEDGIIDDFDDSTELITTEHFQYSTFQVPDEKWTSKALKDIAHFLRNYKFNEWDQRYYSTRPGKYLIGYYDSFPIPMLRTLHWKVYQNCDSNFYKCITYLESVLQTVPFRRNDDIVTFLNEKSLYNKTVIHNLNSECREAKLNSERNSFPFDSFIEKFQWRTTAAYYMCWYTMLGTPALSMLGEACDNFANCLDTDFGHRHRDPRSDDRLSFSCAMYSFCPDPCCSLKHVEHLVQCYKNVNNPCFEENRERAIFYKKCFLDRKKNTNLKSIISNKWNVTCNCQKNGYVWKSQFGLCVDENECLTEKNPCDSLTEDCLNIPGSYKCICKWGYQLDNNKSKCIKSNFDLELYDY